MGREASAGSCKGVATTASHGAGGTETAPGSVTSPAAAPTTAAVTTAPAPASVPALGQAASRLVAYGLATHLIEGDDARWAYNRLLEAVGLSGPEPDPSAAGQEAAEGYDFEADLALLAEAGVARGLAEDTATGRDRLAMRLMGELTPRPSEVSRTFRDLLRSRGARAATDWFYRLCCDADYVRRSAIARNLAWTTDTRWGALEITINKSKPEKDPRDIAAAGASVSASYPACALCRENEGYSGRAAADAGGHAARQNLRIVPVRLGGEGYGLQYSPYAYFEEHCIVMSDVHRPMHVDAASLGCLLDFVDLLPHYFVGSNADLPLVGGSILSHDHFQGGRHEFAMMRARESERFRIAGAPGVSAAVLEWPMTALRLASADRSQLVAAAVRVLELWRGWDDPASGVVSHDPDGTRHNTVTPICRKRGDVYELYLALRCNVTTEAHPLGLFCPHEDKWHVKKENIGLIEVMGLAILPARLEAEVRAVREHLVSGDLDGLESDPLASPHATWARGLAASHPELFGMGEAEADRLLRREVGLVFASVLEDAGVFAWDEKGRRSLGRFLAALGR